MKELLEKFCLLATKLAATTDDVEALNDGVAAFEQLIAELQGSIYDMELEAVEMELLEEYHKLAEAEKEEAENTEKIDDDYLQIPEEYLSLKTLTAFVGELRKPNAVYTREASLEKDIFYLTLKTARQDQQRDSLLADRLVRFIESKSSFGDRLLISQELLNSSELLEKTLKQADLEELPLDSVKADFTEMIDFFTEFSQEQNPRKLSRHIKKILNKRYDKSK